MPDKIRITGGSIWNRRWRSSSCDAIATGFCCITASVPVRAAEPIEVVTLGAYVSAVSQLDSHEIAALGLTLGILCFAVVTAIMLVRTRRRLAETEAQARDQAIGLRARADRANALPQSEPQVVIAWSTTDEEPEIIGDPNLVTGFVTDLVAHAVVDLTAADHVLDFGSWLEPDQARAIGNAVEALRARGVGFAMTLTTQADRLIEADGQAIGGRAVLRLRNVSGIRHELGELLMRHQKQMEETEALRMLVDAVTVPIWARDAGGRLVFANPAYAGAVDARDGADVVERGIELFDGAAR